MLPFIRQSQILQELFSVSFIYLFLIKWSMKSRSKDISVSWHQNLASVFVFLDYLSKGGTFLVPF